MEAIYPRELLACLKSKYLLLDTNVFIDYAFNEPAFTNFLNLLKSSDVTLAITDVVRFEFFKGAKNALKYAEKELFLKKIVDVDIPAVAKTMSLGHELIKEYGIEGSVLSSTDVILGSLLKQYPAHIYLMTRDTTDFICGVFNLCYMVNIPHDKGVFSYGIYKYPSKADAPTTEVVPF